jgi:SAM-dependent methyltransferase
LARFANPAEAYDRHMGRYGAQLAASLIEVAGIRAGQRVLDVGCGPGPLSRALAERSAVVAAIDPSADFVAACHARVPDADVRVGVAEDLPFPSDSFDATLAQLVVQLMSDRDAGVAEMVRVTREGGVVAACVWDSTTMPVLRAFWDAALAAAPERASAIDDGRRVGYEDPDRLGELWQARGLVDVSTGELWCVPTTRASTTSLSHSRQAPGIQAPATHRWTTTAGNSYGTRLASGSATPTDHSPSPRGRGGYAEASVRPCRDGSITRPSGQSSRSRA